MAKVKKSLSGGNMIESVPKKLVKELDNIQNTLQLAAITLKSVIVVKDDNNYCSINYGSDGLLRENGRERILQNPARSKIAAINFARNVFTDDLSATLSMTIQSKQAVKNLILTAPGRETGF